MEDKMNMAGLFLLVNRTGGASLAIENFLKSRTEHTNENGDIYHQFKDGSIYSSKHADSFDSLDSLKDVLLETYGAMQDECKTLDEVLSLKCA